MASSSEELKKYEHSPVHVAVLQGDHAALRRIAASLPKLRPAEEVQTEADSISEEQKADAISAIIDRRDVPRRETALHLTVHSGDAEAAEILMSAGADWSLQNELGWSALQEAVCARAEGVAMAIMRHYQPLAWAKWCRRLPRLVEAMRRMRDFYMEITFHFESSVIPFIGRIAPSDTYKIWKRGSNLRADMTLAGFDGFRIQRSDQSVLFLGDGSEEGRVPPGSLCMLSHKDKEIMNALEGAGTKPSDVEIGQEVAAMSQTNMYRPGIDVTEAVLVPQLTWRRQDKTEMVGPWKAKVYDMHHVTVSVKSRRVPGAMTDDELFSVSQDPDNEGYGGYADIMTEEEEQQLKNVFNMVESEAAAEDGICQDQSTDFVAHRRSCYGREDFLLNEKEFHSFRPVELNKGGNNRTHVLKEEKKGWFSWGKKNAKPSVVASQENGRKFVPARTSLSVEGKIGDLLGDRKKTGRVSPDRARRSVDVRSSSNYRLDDFRKGKEVDGRRSMSVEATPSGRRSVSVENGVAGRRSICIESAAAARRRGRTSVNDVASQESEYKKGVRPVLWLTSQFPLKIDELLPLLDILSNKVKAIRRLRELLTTKLPSGTFPVKVAIPVIPTIRVIVTFTKFEELQSSEEFSTPVSSPEKFQDCKAKEIDSSRNSSSSWFQWIKGQNTRSSPASNSNGACSSDTPDPFVIPSDYTWTTIDEKKKRGKDKKPKVKKDKKDGPDKKGES